MSIIILNAYKAKPKPAPEPVEVNEAAPSETAVTLQELKGIFTYPPNPPKYPNGKLRLLFECNPFSFLMEQAGGASSNGEIDIMDIKVEELHQRTPIFIGSKDEVKKVVEMMK